MVLFYIHQSDNITAGELKKYLATIPDDAVIDTKIGDIRFDNYNGQLIIEQC